MSFHAGPGSTQQLYTLAFQDNYPMLSLSFNSNDRKPLNENVGACILNGIIKQGGKGACMLAVLYSAN